ncbi:MAG: coenzyme F420-0:L-glutamate ligase, partial [Terriglobales bacterium]
MPDRARQVHVIPVRGIGEVRPGDALAEIIVRALRRQRLRLQRGDILVVTHKVVSKAEGRIVPLAEVHP